VTGVFQTCRPEIERIPALRAVIGVSAVGWRRRRILRVEG
jgi:hypothetical protein